MSAGADATTTEGAEVITETTDAAETSSSDAAKDDAAQGDAKDDAAKDDAAQGDAKDDAAKDEGPTAEQLERGAPKLMIAVSVPNLVHAGKPAELGTVLFDGCIQPGLSAVGVLQAVQDHLVQVKPGATPGDILLYGRRNTATKFGTFTAGGWVGKGKLADGFSLDVVAQYFLAGKAAEEPAE